MQDYQVHIKHTTDLYEKVRACVSNACVCACVHACVCMCVRVCVRARVPVRVHLTL